MNRISSARVHATARQHGAMEFSTPPCDLDEVRRYRLGRIRQALVARDLAGNRPLRPGQHPLRGGRDQHADLVHPQRGALRLRSRGGSGGALRVGWQGTLLCADIPTIDEIRPAVSFLYFGAGPEQAAKAREWAADLDSVIREHSGGNRRIAIDRIAPQGVIEMQRSGYEIFDGFEVMENAREIKSAGEIALMRPLHRGMRAGDRPDARGAPTRHHRERALGGAPSRQTSREAASGSRPASSPPDRAPTPGSASARCGSSSAATW